MSKPGDVVWADRRAWMRGYSTGTYRDKHYWHNHVDAEYIDWKRLKDLRSAKDFAWVVKNGKSVTEDYESSVTAEHKRIEALEQALDAAIKARKMFQDDYAKAAKENQELYKELVEAEQKLQVHQNTPNYVDGYGDGAKAEQAAIVKWLTGLPLNLGSNWADAIKRGEHLEDDDE